MKDEIIDANDSEETALLTTVAKLRWKLAASWMMVSAGCGLAGIFILFVALYLEDAFRRIRFEEMIFLGFSGIMTLKYIFYLVNGLRTRRALDDDHKAEIENAASGYKYLWIAMGIMAAFFLFCMLAYWVARVALLGKISAILFRF